MSRDKTIQAESARAIVSDLYEQYYDRVVRYIFVRISDINEAENLGGDVFLKVLQSLNSYRGSKDNIRAWLFKITRNVVIDYLRKSAKRKSVPIDDIEIPDQQNLEELTEMNSRIKKLSSALERLTPAQREVIGLRFFAGLSSDETGKVMGKRSGAVREMQRAAIALLRKEMYA